MCTMNRRRNEFSFPFVDTIEVMAGYVDLIVLRHPSPEVLTVS